jgi:predicted N-acetyltransferase YhbS
MSDANVAIRLLQNSDSLAALTELLHRAYAPLGEMGMNFKAIVQSVAETENRAKRGVCFVAVAGEELIGTISLWPPHNDPGSEWYHRPEVASANQFAVEPQWQKQGIGGRLLARGEQWAREAGYSELAVDTALPATHLIDYYTRHGFRQVEFVTWPLRNFSSVILSKTLDRVAHGR